MSASPETHRLVVTAAATGTVIDLPEDAEDLLIAVTLYLLRDRLILEAEYVIEDVLDAEQVG